MCVLTSIALRPVEVTLYHDHVSLALKAQTILTYLSLAFASSTSGVTVTDGGVGGREGSDASQVRLILVKSVMLTTQGVVSLLVLARLKARLYVHALLIQLAINHLSATNLRLLILVR